MCTSPVYVRHNYQFDCGHSGQVNSIVFYLLGCILRGEIVLLTYNVFVRSANVRGPSQNEFLSSLLLTFVEHQVNTSDVKRFVKQQPNSLPTRFRCTPARSPERIQRRLNGMRRFFGGEFDSSNVWEIEPIHFR